MTYKEKIVRVCKLLDIEQTFEKSKTKYDGEEEKEGDSIFLPGIKWIPPMFENYIRDVKNQPVGASKFNSKSYQHLEMGALPNSFKIIPLVNSLNNEYH